MSDEMLPEDDLDRGLAAGFGWTGSASPLDSIVPGSSRILLRELPSDAPSAVIRPVPSGNEGRYQVLGEIARGAVGVVFKGHDVDLGRAVAIKVLRAEHTDDASVVQRFVEEAQVGGQLQHPGIVPVYKLGLRADGRTPWFAMKLVKGRTLSALLSDRKQPADERRRFLGIFEQICQTVAYAHSRGVVHRDLKPANVMIGAFGEVQVVDWGFAKVLPHADAEKDSVVPASERSVIATVRTGSTDSASVVGSIFGTPAYMPPEQARGTVDEVDERSDVFALGAILCEVLTGKPPYVGDAHRLVSMAAQADLDDAFARLAECGADPQIVRLSRTCLVPAKEARPRNAGEVAAGVAGYLASEEEKTRAAQLAAVESKAAAAQARADADAAKERAVHARSQRRLTAAVAVAVLITFAVMGGAWAWMEHERAGRAAEVGRDVDAAVAQSVFLQGRAVVRADAAAAHDALDAVQRAGNLVSSREVGADVRARAAAAMTATEAETTKARRIAALIKGAVWRRSGSDPTVTLRKATALYPACAEAHRSLAQQLDFRIFQRPDYPERRSDLAEVAAEYRKAIELDPEGTQARIDLIRFLEKGYPDPDELLALDEELVRLDPLEPAWLAKAFEHNVQLGRLDEAARIAQATAALDPDEPPLAPRIANLRDAFDASERILHGGAMPDAWKGKQWDLVEACMFARRYATIARLWKAPAFGLVETNLSPHGGLAALRIASLRAGLGEGTDARDVSDEDRARFRRMALGAYSEYLAGLRGQAAPGDSGRPWCARLFTIERTTGQMYPDLPGGFTVAELTTKLPPDEHEGWSRYFTEVARIVADPRGVSVIWQATFQVGSARLVVVRRDAAPAEYGRALQKVQVAAAALPDDADVLSTLGAARYRVGDFEHALESLERGDAAHSASESGRRPFDVAFIAMSLQRLGRASDARTALAGLRELMTRAPRKDDRQEQGLLAEAEELIEGRATAPSTDGR